MSEEKIMRNQIKVFLKDVKERLPEWLKSKGEHKEVLEELEEHIWAKAEDLGRGQATPDTVKAAIMQMGTPRSISREYKRRGTPKVYITEELWPYYVKTLGILILLVIIGNVISLTVSILFLTFEPSGIFNIWSGILGVFVLVTGIFVWLSMEGYLPEDFKSKEQIKKEKKRLEEAKEKGLPVSPKTGKPLKPIVKPSDKIVGGIFGFVFAIILLWQPFPMIFDLMDPAFRKLLQIAAIFSLIDAVITLGKGLLGNQNVSGQQLMLVLMALLKFASIYLFLLFMNSAEIFPIIYWNDAVEGMQVTTIPEEYYGPFSSLWVVVMIIQVISAFYDIYRAGSIAKYKYLKPIQ